MNKGLYKHHFFYIVIPLLFDEQILKDNFKKQFHYHPMNCPLKGYSQLTVFQLKSIHNLYCKKSKKMGLAL